jgi:glycosyltransferase involved in cell wall biosynthesis
LADGMRYLLDNEPVRAQMEGRAQAWARRFDWDQLARDQEGVYLRAMNANSD